MRAVVGRIHDEGVVRDAELVEIIEHLADILVMVDHRIVIRRLPASRLSFALRLGMGVEMHVRGVEPDEEGLARVVLALDEILGRRNKFVVARFHALFRERTGVGHSLFSDFTPTRLFGRIVRIGRPGMHHPARSKSIAEVREILLARVVVHFRLFFGVEVIEVAEELVEAVVGRQHAVEIAKMVLPELAGRVALVLQARGDGHELLRHAGRGAWDADLGEAGAIDALPGDEGRASRRAGLFAVRVGEHHAFPGDDGRCSASCNP